MLGVPSFMLGVGADMIMVTLGTDRHWPVFCVWSGECSAVAAVVTVTSSPPVCSPLHLPSTRKVQKYLSR